MLIDLLILPLILYQPCIPSINMFVRNKISDFPSKSDIFDHLLAMVSMFGLKMYQLAGADL